MKKIIAMLLAAIAASTAGLLPFQSTDVAKLLPVQTVLAIRMGDRVLLSGDEGLRGAGESCGDALDDLKRTAAGEVYLQTAERVVSNDRSLLEELARADVFRPAAAIYLTSESDADAAQLGEYLRARDGKMTVGRLRAALLRGEHARIPYVERTQTGWVIENA